MYLSTRIIFNAKFWFCFVRLGLCCPAFYAHGDVCFVYAGQCQPAGVTLLGHHPKVSHNGRNVGIVFVPFWLASTVLNYLAFTAAPV